MEAEIRNARGVQVKFINVMQLPAYPVPPPPEAAALGLITWDLPQILKYNPGEQLVANVEVSNPTSEERLYVVSYYFLDKQGVVQDEGYIMFSTGNLQFVAFYLPPQAVQPAFFSLNFSCNQVDYTFGLRLLLGEMQDSTVNIIRETCRVQVLLASESTYQRYNLPDYIIPIIATGMVGLIATAGISIAKSGGKG